MTSYCPTCPQKGESEQSYRERLRLYLSSLPEEIKTPQIKYAERLLVCNLCPELKDETCALCGCYVSMRAAKAAQNCPEERW
ncbi:hypothetical protein FACS189490_05790 [Clostridia bacterium]|nr:hypothetical protein FACS189490_05790 [Clostridia bacterium]